MKKRILTAVILLPVIIVFLFVLPKVCTAILASLVAAVAAYELLWGTGLAKDLRLVIYCAVMAAFAVLWFHFGLGYIVALLALLVFTALLYMEMMISHGKLPFQKICLCYLAGIIIPFFIGALVRILDMDLGRYLIATPFVACFMPDAGAYFFGRAFGKHKMSPNISPNKTIEGAIGGVLTAMIGMEIYGLILHFICGLQVNYLLCLLYGLLGAGASILGDLFFSAVKRQTGIKDYGKIIPGHGGIMDRLDSLTLVSPLMEALLLLIPFAVK